MKIARVKKMMEARVKKMMEKEMTMRMTMMMMIMRKKSYAEIIRILFKR